MRLVAGLGDRQVVFVERAFSRATRSAGRNGESQGTVATSGCVAAAQAGVQAGERPGEAADRRRRTTR